MIPTSPAMLRGTSAALAEAAEPMGERADGGATSGAVQLRPVPYPYRATLAICSDLDETPDAHAYLEMARFLNTTEETSLGRGVGLEVGNSIYFDMAPGQFAYWNTDDRGRAAVRSLIQSGHIDCLHSFGDLATSRAHAGRALDELVSRDCRLTVWVDHAVAQSNFGTDIMAGAGDDVTSPVYHADLTCAFGIEYVWRGRVTSIIGQDVRGRLAGLATAAHPVPSGLTVLKEAAKGTLGRFGSRKYAAHAANRSTWPARLRSGQAVVEFLRSNPSWGGVSRHETADGFPEVVTPAMLDLLAERGGACLLYTHLGKIRQRGRPLAAGVRAAFERLATVSADGALLVTTTARLLDYLATTRALSWSARVCEGHVVVSLTTSGERRPLERGRLSGLTFYVDDPERSRLVVDDVPWTDLQRNAPDHTGRPSISVPWRRLTFPAGVA